MTALVKSFEEKVWGLVLTVIRKDDSHQGNGAGSWHPETPTEWRNTTTCGDTYMMLFNLINTSG